MIIGPKRFKPFDMRNAQKKNCIWNVNKKNSKNMLSNKSLDLNVLESLKQLKIGTWDLFKNRTELSKKNPF